MVYLIGSLENPAVLHTAKMLRDAGIEVFDDWMASSPHGDLQWQAYAKQRGWSYLEALKSPFVQTAFHCDFDHLKMANAAVLIMTCGRSGHLELGWVLGSGKPGYILFPDGEPDRYDLMTNLATGIFFSVEALIIELQKPPDHAR